MSDSKNNGKWGLREPYKGFITQGPNERGKAFIIDGYWWWTNNGKDPAVFDTKEEAEKFRTEVCVSQWQVLQVGTGGATSKPTNPKDAIGDTKVPLWLCSPIAKAAWSVAQFCGLTKYGAWNWRVSGVRTSVYLSAMQRHLDRYLSGEELDPVDGTEHLGNIMACAAIILDAKAAGKLTDDRPPSVSVADAYARAEATMAALKTRYADKQPRHCTIADTEESK